MMMKMMRGGIMMMKIKPSKISVRIFVLQDMQDLNIHISLKFTKMGAKTFPICSNTSPSHTTKSYQRGGLVVKLQDAALGDPGSNSGSR